MWTAAASVVSPLDRLKLTPLSDLTPEQLAEWKRKAKERQAASDERMKKLRRVFRKVTTRRTCRHCGFACGH